MDEIGRITMDFVQWVVEQRGNVPFLDAAAQAELREALDSDADGIDKATRVIGIIDANVDKKDVSRWARERGIA